MMSMAWTWLVRGAFEDILSPCTRILPFFSFNFVFKRYLLQGVDFDRTRIGLQTMHTIALLRSFKPCVNYPWFRKCWKDIIIKVKAIWSITYQYILLSNSTEFSFSFIRKLILSQCESSPKYYFDFNLEANPTRWKLSKKFLTRWKNSKYINPLKIQNNS